MRAGRAEPEDGGVDLEDSAAGEPAREGRSRVLRGTYQSPILVQWQAPEGLSRGLEVSLVRLY